MRILCPKCQFENNAQAAQIVCARCATLIEVNSSPGADFASGWGMDDLSQRVTKPMSSLPNNFAVEAGRTSGRDPFATQIEPDGDEVLDIPRLSNGAYPMTEPGAIFEDVLPFAQGNAAVQGSAAAAPAAPFPVNEFSEFARPEAATVIPVETPNAYVQESASVFAPPPVTDYSAVEAGSVAPSIQFSDFSQSNGAGESSTSAWPVLAEEHFEAKASSGDALFSTEPKSRSLLPRILLTVVVFAGLAAAAWYFLYDKFVGKPTPVAGVPAKAPNTPAKSANPATSAAPANATAAPGNAAANNPAGKTDAQKTAAATSPAPAAGNSNAPATAATSPAPGAAKKTEVTPTPAVAGGHSVNRNEGGIAVQVGSFNNLNEANQRATSLKSAGIEARVIKADLQGKGTWYRVQAGRFTSRDEASRWAAQQKARNVIRDFMVTGFQAN